MKCWRNCWIIWFQWDRTWTAIIDFNGHLSPWICLKSQVWYVYIVPYTTVEAIKVFLSPEKLWAIHKSNWLAPHHLHEGLHSLIQKACNISNPIWIVRQTLGVSIPLPAFFPRRLKMPGFWLQFGMGCWAVPCAVWHAKGKKYGRSFWKECGLPWGRVHPGFGTENHQVIGEMYVKNKAEEKREFDGNRPGTLGSWFI